MKIAVPTTDNVVNAYFGHCESFTIFTFNEKGVIVSNEIMPSPQECVCKSDIATLLKQKGVRVLLAGNMDDEAYNSLRNIGIRVYRGCSGDVLKLTEDYIQGKIVDAGTACYHQEPAKNHLCSHTTTVE